MSRQKRERLERIETLARKVVEEWNKTRHGGSLVELDEAIERLEQEMDHS
ncbi:hypothetical protein [Acidipropionibacterium acidipropionici]|nr:hypothetical protein [Acidipropionibacterium acidipropionici]